VTDTANKFSVVVFSSGGGGNFRKVVEGSSLSTYSVRKLIVDRSCPAEAVAHEMGIEVEFVSRTPAETFWSRLDKSVPDDTDLIVLAGYMPIVPAQFLAKWSDRVINTHPSLLPDFGGLGMYGVKVHEAVLRAGVSDTGCTVHIVNEIVDGGRILAQKRVKIISGESAWELGGRVFNEEGPLLVRVISELSKVKN
jgi:phosphoribosylglycinamide formyltransferase 1